ncbi:hypothetical protein KC19_VG326100 [Ceratodon purpureus]|uniref:Uncharacterized protein n=1 Tax=Ceratodon purpureus TaxID=3225 RepID=A0A8T0HWN5_CERPU|nr:hypothetical protein KC19_VG326100 [Ceratodon purpureus]
MSRSSSRDDRALEYRLEWMWSESLFFRYLYSSYPPSLSNRTAAMAKEPTVMEVLRELDEVRARYFALTVTSTGSKRTLKIPATYTAKTGGPLQNPIARS